MTEREGPMTDDEQAARAAVMGAAWGYHEGSSVMDAALDRLCALMRAEGRLNGGRTVEALEGDSDPIAALNAIQGWTDIDPAYMEAMQNGMFGGGNNGSGAGPGLGADGVSGPGDW